MTIDQIHSLRAERTELQDLLDDLDHALEMNPASGPAQSEKGRLVHVGYAHETLGRSMRFRAEHGLFSKS